MRTAALASPLVRRIGAVTVAVAATVAISGCQAGFQAQTSRPYNPTNGQNVNIPASPSYYQPYLALRSFVVVTDPAGRSVLVGKIINKTSQPDALMSVTAGNSAAKLPSSGVPIGPQQTASFGTPSGPTATWSNIGTQPGHFVNVTLSFQNSGDVTMRALVMLNRYDYADTYFPPAKDFPPTS